MSRLVRIVLAIVVFALFNFLLTINQLFKIPTLLIPIYAMSIVIFAMFFIDIFQYVWYMKDKKGYWHNLKTYISYQTTARKMSLDYFFQNNPKKFKKLAEKWENVLNNRLEQYKQNETGKELYPDIDDEPLVNILESELKLAVSLENFEKAIEIQKQIQIINNLMYGNNTNQNIN
jgi:energy-coupling factor transporter transmembrane protein EcfT